MIKKIKQLYPEHYFYDLHMHTYYSSCSLSKPAEILKRAKQIGLNGICVLDHNELMGSLKVSELNKDKDFEVINGIEVSTNHGDLIGMYVNEGIQKSDFFEVCDAIHEQGGLACVAHPFNKIGRSGLDLDIKEIKKAIDAVEGFNARNLFRKENELAKDAANQNRLPVTGGSDAHFIPEIGRGITILESDDLRYELKKRQAICMGTTVFSLVYRGASSFIRLFRG